MKLAVDSKISLNNGVEMPFLGLGVYMAASGPETQRAVRTALDAGYRMIDTARAYGNERDVGIAIRESRIPREEIFVATKLHNRDHGYKRAIKAFEDSLRDLGTGYVDLYLIHWPLEKLRGESWKALEWLSTSEECRAIGVSNYTIRHLDELLKTSKTVPAVNQVELSPFLYQKDLIDYCRARGIAVEAYSPLTRGYKFDDPAIRSLSMKYGKTPAQILIRWALEHSLIVIPKSVNKERIIENAAVFDFFFSADDLETLDRLDEGYRRCWDPTRVV